MPAARFLGDGITVQDDPRHLSPVRTVAVRIQQAQIGDVVLFVVGGDVWPIGGLIFDIWIKLRLPAHQFCPLN